MKNRRIDYISYILLGVTIVIFFLANRYARFEMDDLWYSTNLVTGEPLRNFGDVIESQIWHFFNWGGRSIAHGQLQIILLLGERAADLLNMVALALLVTLICKHAGVKREGAIWLGLTVAGLLVFLNANWYQTLFWQSGACNYLYMCVWILLFLYPYMRSLEVDEYSPKLIWLWIIPLGLISGWSNENMGPTVFLGTLAVIIILKKKSGKVLPWQILGCASCLIGSALCILAPGNFVRVTDAASTDTSKSLLWRAFIRCYETANGLLYFLAIPVVILALLSFINAGILGKKIGVKNILFICMGIVSWGAMILSPHYPDRASFGSMVFMLIPIIGMFGEILGESKAKAVYSKLLCAIMWLVGVFPPAVYICQQLGWIK